MSFLESLLTAMAAASLLARALFYPRVPRTLDWLVIGAASIAGLHVALEGVRALLLPVYTVVAIQLLAAIGRRGKEKATPARGWARRLGHRTLCAAALLAVSLSAGIVSILSPLATDPDEIFSLLTSSPPDFSSLPWTEAFERLHGHLERDYAFSEWKRIDWDGLHERIAPKVGAAERERDEKAFYLALREYAYSFPDGHVGLEGDDRGARAGAIGGGFGLGVARLDDGSSVVHLLLPGGPAARAGIAWGARVLSWDDVPVDEAIEGVTLLWADAPPATAEGRLLARYKLLPRAPSGTKLELEAWNPGETGPRSFALTAEDDSMKAFELSDPRPGLSLREPAVTWSVLPEGVGYVRILAEMPTLGGPFPHRDFRRALSELSLRGVEGLVLDVRGNEGGFDKLVPEMMGPFFEERTLYEQVAYRTNDDGFAVKTEKTLYVEPLEPRFSRPVAVLVDENTVSSGEGFALLARNVPGARVVGWAGTHGSFGMSGSSVRLPCGLSFTYPNGRSLDAEERIQVDSNDRLEGGIAPDVRVSATIDTLRARWLDGRDVALDVAVREILSSRR